MKLGCVSCDGCCNEVSISPYLSISTIKSIQALHASTTKVSTLSLELPVPLLSEEEQEEEDEKKEDDEAAAAAVEEEEDTPGIVASVDLISDDSGVVVLSRWRLGLVN